jgi:hypothetical protein
MMRRDRLNRLTHALPPGFSLPERTTEKSCCGIKRGDGSGRISVPLYRKIRGQDVWIKRTEAELDAALSKAATTKQLAYLRNVELPALAH